MSPLSFNIMGAIIEKPGSSYVKKKPDGNVQFTLNAGPVLDVLEDVDWLLAVAVDVDRTPVHLGERLCDRPLPIKSQNW